MFRVLKIAVLLLWLSSVLSAAEPSGVWLDVPFVKQEKNGCGAASIAMVMQYWREQLGQPAEANADAEQIQRALYSNAAHGIYASSMERYFRRNGYRVFTFHGEWRDLEQHLKKGRPLIAALKPGSTLPIHYVVVAGLDQERQLVLLNDPGDRKLVKEERARFAREWNAADGWVLLAVPEARSH